jgi:hypothetical protein
MLRKEPGLQVELVDGDRGEFTVLLDDREVLRKGESLPEPQQVMDAVRKARDVGAT